MPFLHLLLLLLLLSTPPSSLPQLPLFLHPPSPLSYWEVFHEQLGPGRGEVSERGALCIIQWLSGVCMCACVYICVSVCVCVCVCVCVWPSPPLLAGVRWRAGHVTGCQLAFYWSSHTVHNITISWWGTLKPVSAHTLWSAALMSHGTLRPCQLQSTLPSFGLIFTHFRLQWVECKDCVVWKSTHSGVLNIYFLLCNTQCFVLFFC